MCNKKTKQRFIFLSSFNQDGSPTSKAEIEERMGILSHEFFKTSDYATRKHWVKQTANEFVDEGVLSLEDANSWRITDDGIASREYSYNCFIEPALKE